MVAPTAPTSGKATAVVPSRGGFFRTFGCTGVLLVHVFTVSGFWTLGLAIIQLNPTAVANYLMGTADLDFGDFWLLSAANSGLAISSAAMLTIFALGYFGLVVEMLLQSRTRRPMSLARSIAVFPRPSVWSEKSRRSGPRLSPRDDDTTSGRLARPPRWSRRLFLFLRRYGALVTHWLDHPLVTLPKLLLQTTTLFQYLREGFPTLTIFLYAALLLVNWSISMHHSIYHTTDTADLKLLSSFDLFFAVFAPMEMLVYAYNHFNFDRDEFATRVQTLNPGNFDVVARLFADPVEISVFRTAFRALQLTSVTGLLVKIGLNTLTIRKWWLVIHQIVRRDASSGRFATSTPRAINKTLGAAFFSAGIAIFAYAVVSVVTSTHVCKPFQQCRVPSYQWNVNARQCTCSVFVDRQTLVRNYTEWENLVDTTSNLAALAAAGDLKVVQIINRQLPAFPPELRNCRGLEQLILIYTKTLSIPDWAKEFSQLEYFHIEGDFTSSQLTYMPQDLFSLTPHLLFLHLGCLPKLPRVPDLDGLFKLKYLVLAILHSVHEFPSFDSLVSLQSLVIVDSLHVLSLPSLKNVRNLVIFAILGRNPTCCNGFLTGKCDLSSFSCQDRSSDGEPRIECTNNRVAASDLVTLSRAAGGDVCATEIMELDVSNDSPSRQSSDGICGGVKYSLCHIDGKPGICVAQRFMPIGCCPCGEYEALRRLQIQRRVGEPCDPVVEKWLGCGEQRF